MKVLYATVVTMIALTLAPFASATPLTVINATGTYSDFNQGVSGNITGVFAGPNQLYTPASPGYFDGTGVTLNVGGTAVQLYWTGSLGGYGTTGKAISNSTGLIFLTPDPSNSLGYFINNIVHSSHDSIIHGELFVGNTATPEPSSLMLLGSGIIGIAGVIRKRVRG